MHPWIVTTATLYFLIMIGIGVYFSRVKIGHEEFMLGGKKIPAWVLALSERATGSSAWLMLGFTGFVFATGLSAVWTAVGSAIGAIFAWLFLAKKFLRETNKTKALTLPSFIAVRFNHNRNIIIYSASLLIILFFTFYIGAQIAGAGKTLYSVFNINSTLAMLLCTALVVILAFWGGFTSVVWTDMIQAIMMLLTLTVIPILALVQIYTNDLSISQTLARSGNGMDSWTGGLTGFAVGVLITNNFSNFFGYFGGQPQLSTRFMALKNEKEATIGTITVIFWAVISFTGAFLIGLAGIALYGQAGITDVETVLPILIMDLTPPWIAGLFLAGIIAAIVTTADSQLIVVVSSINEDILHKAMGLKLSEQKLMKISRLLVILTGLTGLMIALFSESLVFDVVNWAWAGVGCTLSAVVLLSFLWKRYSSIGAVATILFGLIFTIIWVLTPLESIITSRITTFFIAGFFGIVFTLLFPDKPAAYSQDDTSYESANT